MRKICAIVTGLSWVCVVVSYRTFFSFVMITRNDLVWINTLGTNYLVCHSHGIIYFHIIKDVACWKLIIHFSKLLFFFFLLFLTIEGKLHLETLELFWLFGDLGGWGRRKSGMLAYGLMQKTSSSFKGPWSFLHKNIYEFSKSFLVVEECYPAVSVANFGKNLFWKWDQKIV